MKSEILIVDDDRSHLSMLRTVLQVWGFQTVVAEDGQEAIQAVRDRPFDGILMDVRMANISGIEALREVKSINPAIPVVLSNGNYVSERELPPSIMKGVSDLEIKGGPWKNMAGLPLEEIEKEAIIQTLERH